MKAEFTKDAFIPVMALTKAMKPDGLEEPSTPIMAVKTGNQSGRDGEALEPRHGVAQKAMKADVTKELSTPVKTLKKPKKRAQGRACS